MTTELAESVQTHLFYDVNDLLDTYKRDTEGHFFDPDTMRFFGCKVSEIVNLGIGNGAIVIMRQLKNGFAEGNARFEKIYKVARYTPGTEHRCGECRQRDQRGTIDYLGLDEGYATLARARAFVKSLK